MTNFLNFKFIFKRNQGRYKGHVCPGPTVTKQLLLHTFLLFK